MSLSFVQVADVLELLHDAKVPFSFIFDINRNWKCFNPSYHMIQKNIYKGVNIIMVGGGKNKLILVNYIMTHDSISLSTKGESSVQLSC